MIICLSLLANSGTLNPHSQLPKLMPKESTNEIKIDSVMLNKVLVVDGYIAKQITDQYLEELLDKYYVPSL